MSKIYYNQMDSRWKNHPYTSAIHPTATIGTSGCGVTCGAMVVSSAREIITPDTMGNISKENGYRGLEGTDYGFFQFIANKYGFETRSVRSSYEAHQACKDGYFVVICCGAGLWTDGGHYILAVGANDTEIEIYDPYLYQGKFNRAGRQGKVRLEGNSAWVEINTFKTNSNAQCFFAYKITDAPTPMPTPSTKQMKVYNVSSQLNVRNAPNGAVIGGLKNGTIVTVYETSGNWARIGDGQWVSLSYLTNNIGPTPIHSKYVLGKYVTRAKSGLNVRKSPVNGAVIKSYPYGTRFDTYEIQNNWAKTPSGWVCLDYCELVYKY